jgi:nucleoside-diphosphate-sugar epimerase
LISEDKKKIENEIFNVGYQNLSINEISLVVKKIVELEYPEKKIIKIEKTSTDDNRSYHINSDKIYKKLKFKPQYSIEHAVKELCKKFKEGYIKNSFEDDIYFNVKRFKRLQIT